MGTRIPLSLLRDLKCRHCKNFLSCGPVYVTPDCGLLCGRCRALAKPNFRNYIYEELANTFVFPCMNWEKHCPEEGPWNTLKDHEMDCAYSSSCGTLCTDPAAFFSSKRILPNEENLLYLEVPEKCLNLVSCKNCGKYLSCEPIHINIVGSNICHRCYLSNGIPPHTLRNLAYEKLANIFRFPCIFRAKGCPIKFRFGRDSWEHEVNCHYRDVPVPLTPPVLEVDQSNYYNHIDNSGYRPSVEGGYCMNSRSNSRESPKFELPRVSSILRNQGYTRDNRLAVPRQGDYRDQILKYRKDNRENLHHHSESKEETPQFFTDYGRKENNNSELDRNRNPDKERGIVPTHTGHVYATLTKNSVLFAPPQPNKDPSNGQKVTKEFQDKIMRSASNVSQTNYPVEDKIRNSLVSSSKEKRLPNGNEQVPSYNTLGIPAPSAGTNGNLPVLNKSYMRDLEDFNEDYAPVVKQYVQFNPQNNVQRNESLTIGNPDIIAELKVRQQKRNKNREDEDYDSLGLV